jgi:hypothetical protein
MVRCPVMVGVVTLVPLGCLFEPREVKVTSDPGVVDTSYRSASQARTDTRADREAEGGATAL